MPTRPDESGMAMHLLLRRLFPICRSITGPGVRETLAVLQEYIPLTIHEIPTGTPAFDWEVPKEWRVRAAYIDGPDGMRIVDFANNNLHLVGYSIPVNSTMSLAELQPHLHSLPELPDAIPYVTSYYHENWGFCLSHNTRKALKEGQYRVVVDTELMPGSLTYGELIIPGSINAEILISTYVCHPSLANNELSGPVVATTLAAWLLEKPRKFSYRIIFIPETIGALVYISRNLIELKRKTVAGFNVTCIGDDRVYSFLPSRKGDTLADRAALCVLREEHPDFISYSYLDRGSDERQYCSPGVDLPVVSVMRSKYREYPEYHTSLDNCELVTPAGLAGGYSVLKKCMELLERNETYETTCLGEPQLGKRGLYPSLGTRDSSRAVRLLLDIYAYSDGTNDLISLKEILGVKLAELYESIDALKRAGLLKKPPDTAAKV